MDQPTSPRPKTRVYVLLSLVGLILAGLAVAVVLLRPTEAPEEPPPSTGIDKSARALWVWEGVAVTSALARVELLAFCKDQDVSTVFFNVRGFTDNQYNPAYITGLKTLVRRVHEDGLRIHALRAPPHSPKLIYPKAQYVAITYLRDFLIYNHGLEPEESFDGYLEDIQPQSLPGWAENRAGVQEAFAEFVREYRKTIIEFDDGLPLGWTMPTDFDAFEWLPQVYENLDYVVLATGGLSDTLVASAEKEFELGGQADTQVVLSVRLGDRGFTHKGPAGQLLSTVEAGGQAHTAFGGVAAYDYAAFSSLPDPPEATAN